MEDNIIIVVTYTRGGEGKFGPMGPITAQLVMVQLAQRTDVHSAVVKEKGKDTA